MTVPSYPGYPGATPESKQRPTVVTIATYLLYLVAAFELINAILALSTYGAITRAIKGAYAGTPAEGAEGIVGLSAVIGAVINLLLGGGFAVLGILDGRGRNVARIITWVIGGISLCCLGAGLGSSALVNSMNVSSTTSNNGPSSSEVQQRIKDALPSWYQGVSMTLTVVALLAILTVIILLALPASNEFFRKQPAGFDPAMPYPTYPGAQYGQPPYPGQPGQPFPGQPQPFAGQPGQPQPGQPQPGQPGGYGQPGQPAPGLPPYPGQPGSPGYPGQPGSPAYPGSPGQPTPPPPSDPYGPPSAHPASSPPSDPYGPPSSGDQPLAGPETPRPPADQA